MTILESIPEITDDDRQLIRILLSNTSLQVQFNGILTAPFQSTIGSPQGDIYIYIYVYIYIYPYIMHHALFVGSPAERLAPAYGTYYYTQYRSRVQR